MLVEVVPLCFCGRTVVFSFVCAWVVVGFVLGFGFDGVCVFDVVLDFYCFVGVFYCG